MPATNLASDGFLSLLDDMYGANHIDAEGRTIRINRIITLHYPKPQFDAQGCPYRLPRGKSEAVRRTKGLR